MIITLRRRTKDSCIENARLPFIAPEKISLQAKLRWSQVQDKDCSGIELESVCKTTRGDSNARGGLDLIDREYLSFDYFIIYLFVDLSC